MSLELCCMCNQPTGRAGIEEDSLFYYIEGKAPIGPLCEECYNNECESEK
jgi:hypothetical protein